MQKFLACLVLAAAFTSGFALAKDPIRIDATSDATTTATWRQMTEHASASQKRELLSAVVKINLAGVNSAREVVGNPNLQSLGILHIKEQVAGLDANEIIELSRRIGTVTVEYQK